MGRFDAIRVAALLGIGAAGAAGCAADAVPPEVAQPIAFNHRVHAVDIEMQCITCHPGAATQKRAGIAPLSACAVCHSSIATDNPGVVRLMGYFERREPLPWNRVNALPATAMVHFKHAPHARAGVGCVACHGDVANMTVAQPVRDTADMMWCIDCHQDQGANTDCLTCHH